MPRTARQAAIDKQLRTVTMPLELLERLEPHAQRRQIHRNQLVREIVEAALDAGLVDAVLDDREPDPGSNDPN
jgi:hypothetical protein